MVGKGWKRRGGRRAEEKGRKAIETLDAAEERGERAERGLGRWWDWLHSAVARKQQQRQSRRRERGTKVARSSVAQSAWARFSLSRSLFVTSPRPRRRRRRLLLHKAAPFIRLETTPPRASQREPNARLSLFSFAVSFSFCRRARGAGTCRCAASSWARTALPCRRCAASSTQ